MSLSKQSIASRYRFISNYRFTGNRTLTSGRIRRCILAGIAAVAFGFIPCGRTGSGSLLSPVLAEAQNFSQRTIQGKVLDDTETPVASATVFLKKS